LLTRVKRPVLFGYGGSDQAGRDGEAASGGAGARPTVELPTFDRIVASFQNKVFRMVYGLVRDHGRAEEITQDTFLKVWQALPVYDGRASLSTWIYTIARNTAFTHLRASRNRRGVPLDNLPEPSSRPSPDARIEVSLLLERLPREQREVVTMFYLQERQIQDVAEALDLPEGTVKSLLHRARRAMAAMMEEEK